MVSRSAAQQPIVDHSRHEEVCKMSVNQNSEISNVQIWNQYVTKKDIFLLLSRINMRLDQMTISSIFKLGHYTLGQALNINTTAAHHG